MIKIFSGRFREGEISIFRVLFFHFPKNGFQNVIVLSVD